MRIAFYAPLKSPTHETPSGDRRVARLLMDALRLGGHCVEMVSDFRSFEGDGDAVRQTRLRDQGLAIAQALVLQWRDGSRGDRPDVWFTYHLYYKAPDWLGPEVSAALDIPYVIFEASYASKRAGGAWAVGHEATRHAIELASLLLCPTRDDMEGVERVAGAATRVLQLAPFLDPAAYRAAQRARAAHRAALCAAYGVSAQADWIVVAAMMRPGDKLASYRVLADVLRSLMDLPWQLVVAGDGVARVEVQGLLEAAAPGRAFFAGLCNEQAMLSIYGAGDLCIWPAVNEAYGMAMLEAQAAGMPVVSCAVRGVPDVVCDGRTGLLAAPGDVAGLADLVRRLLLDVPKRTAMGKAAAQFVQGERSTARAAELLNAAFAGLGGGRSMLSGGVTPA